MKLGRTTDKVRASRDGHEFHEAWAARKSLQLLLGVDGLAGIAVEGFAPGDQPGLSTEAIDIADLVLYYGESPSFTDSNSTVVVQVKYSHSSQEVGFRASDAQKTIKKFAAAFANHDKRYGRAAVDKKLSFEILTNRPIYPAFAEAIEQIAAGVTPTGEAAAQATQFASAARLSGEELTRFAKKVQVSGLAGSLRQNKERLARVLADWSVAPDALARARLGKVRDLLREKAGLAGERNQLITRIDVLAALELQEVEDLLPCPAAFPEIGPLVPRSHVPRVATTIIGLDSPLLIHSDGGVGKTVFLQSLARTLGGEHETELFDCFGGGSYRAPEDARHLPKRGLIHIVNRLACRGLCDPLLPPNESSEDLIGAFRRRLEQAVATLQRGSPDKLLILFIDAIDNAAEQAASRHEPSFPRLLLDSFAYSGAVPGVRLVVSCRTYRREMAKGEVECEEFGLPPFSDTEAAHYIKSRIPNVSDLQIQVAISRSQGNARILEHLALGDRALLEPSEINRILQLDELLHERIRAALAEARARGYPEANIRAFLAGLSVLPAPVPLREYADAHGIELSAVRSFAADLAPLLEQTRHGLMFRDEPTETLVRATYAADTLTLQRLGENLSRQQGRSVYAASALPALLQQLDDGRLLFELAFDDRFPATITSTVGRQRIRYARLRAATQHAARHADFARLVRLLVELSTLAATNQRGAEYIVDNPDLVIASGDVDATRRLFETRTRWPGTRHARLTIADTLAGNLSDAFRHAVKANEWSGHFYRQAEDYRREFEGPEAIDQAALSLCLSARGRERDAAQLLSRWRDWYAFGITAEVLSLHGQGQRLGTVAAEHLPRFVSALPARVGALCGALAFLELGDGECGKLVRRLADACRKQGALTAPESYRRQQNYGVYEGLLKAAGIAVSLNRRAAARRILALVPRTSPGVWSLSDRPLSSDAYFLVLRTALECALDRTPVTEGMLLPHELEEIGSQIPSGLVGDDYRKELSARLNSTRMAQNPLQDEPERISHELLAELERFTKSRLASLVEVARGLAGVLSSPRSRADEMFRILTETWEKLRVERNPYGDSTAPNFFVGPLGRRCLAFALWTRNDLSVEPIEAFVTASCADSTTSVAEVIQLVSILSKRAALHELAGRTAQVAKADIEREDDVGQRGSLLAQLARAMHSASVDEAANYFRTGLEQMDAIGSGDQRFTSELLNFAAAMRGPELDDADFHTLSNLCELNLSESDKFPWAAFGQGLARASGCRTLARLGRWADRAKVSFDYTLLPYLFALVEQDKMRPEIALALLRVSMPVEFHDCGTEQFAQLLVRKRYVNARTLLDELIVQFRQSHPGVFMPRTLAVLSELAERELGAGSDTASYLSCAAPHFAMLRDQDNDTQNHRSYRPEYLQNSEVHEEQSRQAAARFDAAVDPISEDSVAKALEAIDGLMDSHGVRNAFLERVRGRVAYGDRAAYVRMIAGLRLLNIYAKLEALRNCKREWGSSSAGLEAVFRDSALPIVRLHAEDLTDYDYLSHYNLQEIAQLTGVSMVALARELISVFAAADSDTSSSVWLSLATIISSDAPEGETQKALTRLLNSKAAQLASSVADGPWRPGLYADLGAEEASAALIWFALGSPSADQRWRAAHAVRSLARLAQWDVIDGLISRLASSTHAHPHQAPELPFFFLHARLWLVIALARVTQQHPEAATRYVEALKAIALDEAAPHVLVRHFAAKAVLACVRQGAAGISREEINLLAGISASPFPKKRAKRNIHLSFYGDRPASIPEPENDFHLEYDFEKYEVARLGEIFGRSRWQVADDITAWIRQSDVAVQGMYDRAGREAPYRHRHSAGTARYHSYGYYLGWHATYIVAGQYLQKFRVVQSPYDEGDSWKEWLGRRVLTRSDGLWLADGIDWPPVDSQVNLLEPGEKSSVITGSKEKLLSLLKLSALPLSEVTVAGDWQSHDGVSIYIASALAPKRRGNKLASELSQSDPFQAWLPRAECETEVAGDPNRDRRGFEPWIVWPGTEAGLDETDPLGAVFANDRLRLSKGLAETTLITATDPFARLWANKDGKIQVRSEAWGRSPSHDDDERIGGRRLVCSSALLRNILVRRRSELVVLIRLRRYVKRVGYPGSEYWHTLMAVRVDANLNYHAYPGVSNKLHETKY